MNPEEKKDWAKLARLLKAFKGDRLIEGSIAIQKNGEKRYSYCALGAVYLASGGRPTRIAGDDPEAEVAEIARRLGISIRVAGDLVKENDQFFPHDDHKRLFYMRRYTTLRAKGMDWLRASTRAQELMERKFPDE